MTRPRQPDPARLNRRQAGFTFIEMVLVLAVLGVLFGIAVPAYRAQVRSAKEAVLQHNLAVIRERLDQYRADRDRYPPTLDELARAGYLRQIPEDPMTGAPDWEEVFERARPRAPGFGPGVADVRSRSEEAGSDGRPYREW